MNRSRGHAGGRATPWGAPTDSPIEPPLASGGAPLAPSPLALTTRHVSRDGSTRLFLPPSLWVDRPTLFLSLSCRDMRANLPPLSLRADEPTLFRTGPIPPWSAGACSRFSPAELAPRAEVAASVARSKLRWPEREQAPALQEGFAPNVSVGQLSGRGEEDRLANPRDQRPRKCRSVSPPAVQVYGQLRREGVATAHEKTCGSRGGGRE